LSGSKSELFFRWDDAEHFAQSGAGGSGVTIGAYLAVMQVLESDHDLIAKDTDRVADSDFVSGNALVSLIAAPKPSKRGQRQ